MTFPNIYQPGMTWTPPRSITTIMARLSRYCAEVLDIPKEAVRLMPQMGATDRGDIALDIARVRGAIVPDSVAAGAQFRYTLIIYMVLHTRRSLSRPSVGRDDVFGVDLFNEVVTMDHVEIAHARYMERLISGLYMYFPSGTAYPTGEEGYEWPDVVRPFYVTEFGVGSAEITIDGQTTNFGVKDYVSSWLRLEGEIRWYVPPDKLCEINEGHVSLRGASR